MNKAQLIALDSANILHNPAVIDEINHSTVNLGLIDGFYQDPIQEESSTSPVYTLPVDATHFPYEIKFTKVGKRVFVDGFVINNNSSAISNNVIFTFVEMIGGISNPFLPETAVTLFDALPPIFRGKGEDVSNGIVVKLLILRDNGTSNSKMRVSGTFNYVVPNNRCNFSFSYNANA